ncbi:MAG: PQQ-like beta-propeller repeat protein [Acidobacteriia bacterium]|nr:PQQ-like beta-propeller repeat protein [Terriglobia bacterium]
MNIAQAGEPAPRKPIRLWPGVVAVVLQWLAMFGVPRFVPDALIYCIFAALAAALAVLVWWAFFSRAPHLDRWGALLLIIVASVATSRLIDKSIAGGMMGFMFPFYSIPVMSLALVAGAAAGHRLSTGPRRASMVGAILLACVGCTLLRTNGINGSGASDFAWRWSKTHEERLVGQPSGQLSALPTTLPAALPTTPPAAPVAAKIPAEQPIAHHAKVQPAALPKTPVIAKTEAEWPGFRGPGRDSIIPGTRIATDWSTSRPVELWRRPVGPGWGSFAVNGDLIYTQEQRGDDEIVTSYNATTGNPVWAHRDATRFWESNAGPGPRATPTLHDGHVYTFGATGIVNALDARDGAVLWSRNAASDTGMKTPGWGFASSPLVLGDAVIVAAAGRLVAYDLATGAPRWLGPKGGDSYSSPHLVTIDGVQQIVLMSAAGATSVAPADGTLLWKYSWPSDTRIMQPAVTADGGLLITGGDAMGGVGMRRIAVAHGPAGWTAEERWTSAGLKPSFNDSVVYDGYVYGFNGAILACIDAKDGTRKWKGGRYGAGQLVLLRDQGVLLVLSEEGELALVKAAPDQFTELARVPAIEGKTWNHPALAGDRLLVRNGNEMAAFRLAPARP